MQNWEHTDRQTHTHRHTEFVESWGAYAPKNLNLRTGQTGLVSESRPESDQDMIYVKCTTIDYGLLDNIMDVKQLSKT